MTVRRMVGVCPRRMGRWRHPWISLTRWRRRGSGQVEDGGGGARRRLSRGWWRC
jgi:hypothetical protein